MNLYIKIFATFVFPVILGLLFTIFSINSLLDKQKELIEKKESLQINHVQQRFVNLLQNMQRDLGIISKSKDIEKAIAINDNSTLSHWGQTFINNTYSTIMFINNTHFVISRANDPYKFGDRLDEKLLQQLENFDEYKGIHIIDNKETIVFSKAIYNYNNERIGTTLIGMQINEKLLKHINPQETFILKYHSLDNKEIYSHKKTYFQKELLLHTFIKHIDKQQRFFIQVKPNQELMELQTFKFNILTFSIIMSIIIFFLLYFILSNFLRPYKKIYSLLLEFANNKIDFSYLKTISKHIAKTSKDNNEIYQMSKAIHKMSKKALKNENELKKISYIDQLTKIYNRRKLDEILLKESYEANRYHKPLSVVMIDIDYFKRINDTHGHPIGDKILKQFATRINENLRTSDFFGRWGGEEFMIICPSTTQEGALALTQKIRTLIKEKPFTQELTVTASFGIGTILEDENFYNLISRTDEALYKAKNSGRDKIELANTEPIKLDDMKNSIKKS